MKHRLLQGDCIQLFQSTEPVDCIFADPPDNIGLGYEGVNDKKSKDEYLNFLYRLMEESMYRSDVFWLSFNAIWTREVGAFSLKLCEQFNREFKACQQVFTFGQNRETDFKNCHRPLYRFSKPGAPFHGDDIRVESWRLANGDKRANPDGCVPSDVFDFPRVVGNSPQRRKWHKTQLHEGLVERCIRSCTEPGDSVLDPCGGTGTTLRVCLRIGRVCTLFELSETYCEQIAAENGLKGGNGKWSIRA